MKQAQIKLTDEERTNAIYQPVYAAAAAIVDTLITAHPEWKEVPSRNIQDRTCNPFHDKFAKSESQSVQALSSRMQNAAPSHVTTRFGGNFRGH